MIKNYVKKPVVIQACQWTGDNYEELKEFTNDQLFFKELAQNTFNGAYTVPIYVKTLEGDMQAPIGAYILRGIKGEFYPCAQDIFEETYMEVNE
jgi:murein L,D-transpeptidase YafK